MSDLRMDTDSEMPPLESVAGAKRGFLGSDDEMPDLESVEDSDDERAFEEGDGPSGGSSECEGWGVDSGDEHGGQVSDDEVVFNLPAKSFPGKPPARQAGLAASRVIDDTIIPAKRRAKAKNTGAKKYKLSSTSADTTSVATNTSNMTVNIALQSLGNDSGRIQSAPKSSKLRARIVFFFELVSTSTAGATYRSYHADPANQREEVFKSTKNNYGGLERALMRTENAEIIAFYQILKSRGITGLPTPIEIAVAQGRQPIADLPEGTRQAIVDIVKAGVDKAVDIEPLLPWDNEEFLTLIGQWQVADDQSFSATESPYLRDAFEYVRTHEHPDRIHLPSGDAMRTRIMGMADNRVDAIKAFITTIPGQVSLSLDAWTSSNGYAFLAIVMHYVSADWKAEELLIDFCELHGEHSGENMADAVFGCMRRFAIENKVIAIMADNASNNDTLMHGLRTRCLQFGIDFNPEHARLRCVPHVVHLAVCKLLEAIGAKPPKDETANYRDDVAAPLGRQHDDDAASRHPANATNTHEDPSEGAATVPKPSVPISGPKTATRDSHGKLLSVDKLRKLVRAVRASPQRREQWLDLVKRSTTTESVTDAARGDVAKMLILDVPTRWSSTEQMLRRGLLYRKHIDAMTGGLVKDLEKLRLTDEDWIVITQVQGWLTRFRQVTTTMSTTSTPILSHTHAALRSLQDDLRTAIRTLNGTMHPHVRDGLVAAHQKLSDYHTIFDRTPYYIWATLLDPRFGPQSLLKDAQAAEDANYTAEIVAAKQSLAKFFVDNYILPPTPVVANAQPAGSTSSTSGLDRTPEMYSFTSRYVLDEPSSPDVEVQDFFAARRVSHAINPVEWWGTVGSREFPALSRLARDILSIPGCAVAVERIFSGARDTIGLRRASLKPDTIRRLMLLKQSLRLDRERAKCADEKLS